MAARSSGSDDAVAFQEHPSAPAVDHRPKRPIAEMRQRFGQRLADRDPDHRNAGGERDAVRQRQRRPDAGEAARPTVTATRSSSAARSAASSSTAPAITGSNAAWPRAVSCWPGVAGNHTAR